MYDTTELDEAVSRLADRLRAAPQSRLGRGAAAEGLALARELAARAQRLEGAAETRVMPDAGMFAVGDQLAVAGADLAEALRDAARREGASGAADRELAEALASVRAAAARAAL
ncbi:MULTISPECIES: hypothetical protein [Streptomyces]|uniref:Uncharacterized protein n=1 Tax=Streptomyces sudanensis TaxID=436397 RepID=A0ABY4TFN3_9ACTN|nr:MULTISPECIES: hypothetical protein [Streptomyces]MCP9958707.1 hypothetical protein [Streptomyces sudanensis]MCP9987799.1 hypothetical protein [Streptomyces sudanensis]MCQ0000798.1 hypothetical protein [Streptomyces sudanensis]URN16381.1 hypothetical protein MW084_11005 [Streptomyces sudanensis]